MNNRSELDGLELDFFIPAHRIAIEFNGIFHHQPIHGEAALRRAKAKDERKRSLCLERSIQLLQIDDLKSSDNIIQTNTQLALGFVRSVINS